MKTEIRYGKHEVSFYRTHPTRGLLAGRASVDVLGDNFLPAYTEGDNRNVVATDTMKNFVYAMALQFQGDRYEPFADFLAREFLQHYEQMQTLRVSIRELPFIKHSDKLLSGPLEDDYESVELERDRNGIRSLRCGRRHLRLIKLTGSAFKSFARDEFTTLPEVTDRPLYIYLDVFWRYPDPARALEESQLVGSEQVRELVVSTFDAFVSMSIQHLVHEMGTRILDRFTDLSEVSFQAQNRLWDTSRVGEGRDKARVFSDPKPAHGVIGLTMRRDG
ncbi:MAG: urate oxidase [Candidatus Dormibacteraeota bacterium]|nr:urate oxidase [Candidatus Dormibacteraeota bacterium]